MAKFAGDPACATEHLTVDPNTKPNADREENVELRPTPQSKRHLRKGAQIGVVVQEHWQTEALA
jgi:hypothetical protein